MNTKYVLITAARNEEVTIEKTIQAVISQTILPQKWVIVSDSSTDRTDEIVKKYVDKYDFICLHRREADSSRNFASQVYAVRAGAEQLNGIEYDFIGDIDADITLQPDYYEGIFEIFGDNPKLGIAGGIVCEPHNGKWIPLRTNVKWSVSGAIQMFRRQCYNDIGGYIPLKKGGQDAIAEVMARMHGWDVRSFPDIEVFHYRSIGSCYGNALVRRFHFGVSEYLYGNHPLFELTKCLYQMKQKPYLLGSIFRLCGYCWAFLRREPREVPAEVVAYMRSEQKKRLWHVVSKKDNQ